MKIQQNMIKLDIKPTFIENNMAKPRVFVSSTYYDLKYIRANLEQFIREFGYEPVLFKNGDIFFKHGKALDESCYDEISHAHMLILIIGGSYGSKSSETTEQDPSEYYNKKNLKLPIKQREEYDSITLKEYDEARNLNLPVFVFVDSQVLSEFETYKKNKNNDKIEYAHVTNIGIFKLIENIRNQKKSNLFTKGFDKFDDIASWLRDQWAAMFADYLKQARNKVEIQSISSKINELDSVTNALKKYSELIMQKLNIEDSTKIIDDENYKIFKERFFSSGFGKSTLALVKGYGDNSTVIDINELNTSSTQNKIFDAFLTSNDIWSFMDKLKLKQDPHKTNNPVYIAMFNDINHAFQNQKMLFKDKVTITENLKTK